MHQYKKELNAFQDIFEIIKTEANTDDDEFIKLARIESNELIEKLLTIQDQIIFNSIVDDCDINECTFEISAGVGGKESSLFANELYSLYQRFFATIGWDIRADKSEFEQVELDENNSLFTETIEVTGTGCYQLLRHEAGVHRVQRIPKTEKYGRIHTSTVSISVLPIRTNLVVVKDSDLKFEMKTSQGAGGQNVNRNFTAVRVTHVPTGVSTECQETRFQYLNKKMAIQKIKALLNQMEYERLEKETRKHKKLQIGIAARSDKIRTYNFPQNRITDHRLTGAGHNQNIHGIERYMNGEECERMKNIMIKLEEIRRNELIRQYRNLFEKTFEEKHGS